MTERGTNMKKTAVLLGLLFCISFLSLAPAVFAAPAGDRADVGAVNTSFMTETEYDVSPWFASAPAEQGEGNKYVLYGDINEYYEMTAEDGAVHKFTALRSNNFVYDRHEFCPDADKAMLMWQAPCNGRVRFAGRIYNRYSYADHGAGTRDGVCVSVYRKASASAPPQTLFTQTYVDDFSVYIDREAVYEVASGEMFFIEIGQVVDGAWDTTGIYFNAEFTENVDDPGDTAEREDTGIAQQVDWTASYAEEQGAGGWFYAYGSPQKYGLMNWGSTELVSEAHWHGPEDYQDINLDYMNAGGRMGVLQIWVAERDGAVALDGTVVKVLGGGDGAHAEILKNEEVLFSHDFSAAPEQAVLPDGLLEIEVERGDKIVFYLNSGAYYNNGWDGVSFRCTVSWLRQEGEKLPESALAAYLTNLSDNDAEIAGVTIVADGGYELSFAEGEGSVGINGVLIGVCVGAAVVLVLAVAIAIIQLRRKRERKKESGQ